MRRLLNETEVRSLRRKLLSLANKYEVPDFLNGDPSWFMHQVIGERNQETIAFIASCLSYGSRNVSCLAYNICSSVRAMSLTNG